ncbi:MAG: 30S ribosomal protein S20 [Candidatus Azosocius agrarius]|nr:MAG: 30S ribosomal protein S20 [Gammaproteobacteria bacterium]
MIKSKKMKKIKQSNKKREHNCNLKSEMKTYIKKVLKAIKDKDQTLANKEFSITSSKLDKLSRKKIIHKNTAARQKSRINKKIKLMNISM